jgi:protein pelota
MLGKNIEENEHVKMGQYHTIDIEVNQPLRIQKERWDAVYLERLKEAADPSAKADVAAVVMQVLRCDMSCNTLTHSLTHSLN